MRTSLSPTTPQRLILRSLTYPVKPAVNISTIPLGREAQQPILSALKSSGVETSVIDNSPKDEIEKLTGVPLFGFSAWDIPQKAPADNKQALTRLLSQAELTHLLKGRVAERYIYPYISPE